MCSRFDICLLCLTTICTGTLVRPVRCINPVRGYNCSFAPCRQGLEYCDEVVGRCSRCVEAVCHLNPSPMECKVFCSVPRKKPDTSVCSAEWENGLSQVRKVTDRTEVMLCALLTMTMFLTLVTLIAIWYRRRELSLTRLSQEREKTHILHKTNGFAPLSVDPRCNEPPPYRNSLRQSPLRSPQSENVEESRPMAYGASDVESGGEDPGFRRCICPQPLDQTRIN